MRIYRNMPITVKTDIAEAIRSLIHLMMDSVLSVPNITPDDANNATYIKRQVDMDETTVPTDLTVTNIWKLDETQNLYALDCPDSTLDSLPESNLRKLWIRACALRDEYIASSEKG